MRDTSGRHGRRGSRPNSKPDGTMNPRSASKDETETEGTGRRTTGARDPVTRMTGSVWERRLHRRRWHRSNGCAVSPERCKATVGVSSTMQGRQRVSEHFNVHLPEASSLCASRWTRREVICGRAACWEEFHVSKDTTWAGDDAQ